jgi:hypothetical protein
MVSGAGPLHLICAGHSAIGKCSLLSIAEYGGYV